MSQCTKCGTRFIGTAADPPGDGLCHYCERETLKAMIEELHQQDRLKTREINTLVPENRNLIAQRDEAIEALRALVSTAIRHRWHVNSDEPDTINAAMDLLAKTAPPNPNAGVVQVSPKGRWTTEEAEEEGLKIMKEQEGTP